MPAGVELLAVVEDHEHHGLVRRWLHWSPILKLLRGVGAVIKGKSPAHIKFRERLLGLIGATVILDLIVSALMLPLEEDAAGTEIHNFGDSLFYVTAQLLTISSAMHNPLTTWGRILDCLLMAYAITVVAALAGMFANFFHVSGQEDQAG